MAGANTFLGRFAITGLEARLAGHPQIAVTFALRDGEFLLEAHDVEGQLSLQIEALPTE